MDTKFWLAVALVVLPILSVVVPFSPGELVRYRSMPWFNLQRYTNKAIVSLILILITMGLGIWNVIIEWHDERESGAQMDNVESCMENADENLKKAYDETIKITDSLKKLNANAQDILGTHKRSIGTIDSLSKLMADMVKNAKDNFVTKRPMLNVVDIVEWVALNDTLYQISFSIANIDGSRPAINAKVSCKIIQTDLNNVPTLNTIRFAPIEMPFIGSEGNAQFKFSSFNLKDNENNNTRFYIKIICEYEDFFGDKYNLTQYYANENSPAESLHFLHNNMAKVVYERLAKQLFN